MMSICAVSLPVHTEGCQSWKVSLAKLRYHELQFAYIDDLYMQMSLQSPHSLSAMKAS